MQVTHLYILNYTFLYNYLFEISFLINSMTVRTRAVWFLLYPKCQGEPAWLRVHAQNIFLNE